MPIIDTESVSDERPMGMGPMTPTPELEGLKQQASYFQDALADIQKRVDELAAQTK